ncbi:MAG: hypothetical protein LBQ23_01015, partial [Puniceicoccales bacterium]|nr:hypothetical protein [Puniceicoccales bacterium]
MSFSTTGEINMSFQGYCNGPIELPAGRLLVSGRKTSFLPNGSQTVYGYETDNEDKIIGHYINGEQVTWEGFRIKIRENKEIAGSNFGQKPLCDMTSILAREASRFLTLEEASSTTTEKKEEIADPKSVQRPICVTKSFLYRQVSSPTYSPVT